MRDRLPRVRSRVAAAAVATWAPGDSPGNPPECSMVDSRPPHGHAVAAAAALLLYTVTLAPTVWFWDSGEYVAAAATLGIPLPPGNPFFVLLGKVWITLLSPTGLPVTARMNLLGAASSASATGILSLVAHRVLTGWMRSRVAGGNGDRTAAVVRVAGAWAGAILAATAFTVWNQSNLNEKVYTLSVLAIALVSWLAILWTDRKDRVGSEWLLVLAVYVMALGSTNHLMSVLPAPALALLVLCARAVRETLHSRRSGHRIVRSAASVPRPPRTPAPQLLPVLRLAVGARARVLRAVGHRKDPRLPRPSRPRDLGAHRERPVAPRSCALPRHPCAHALSRARLLPELPVRLFARARVRGPDDAGGPRAGLLLHRLVPPVGLPGRNGARRRLAPHPRSSPSRFSPRPSTGRGRRAPATTRRATGPTTSSRASSPTASALQAGTTTPSRSGICRKWRGSGRTSP